MLSFETLFLSDSDQFPPMCYRVTVSEGDKQIYGCRLSDSKHFVYDIVPLLISAMSVTHIRFLPHCSAVERKVRVLRSPVGVWEEERRGIQHAQGQVQHLAG